MEETGLNLIKAKPVRGLFSFEAVSLFSLGFYLVSRVPKSAASQIPQESLSPLPVFFFFFTPGLSMPDSEAICCL